MSFYLIGIKGSGMSSLAKILIKLNEDVSGCDYNESFYTEEGLEKIRIDDINNFVLDNTQIYIIGNAFKNHSITKKIIENKFKFFYYPEFLVKYFKNYLWISIAGSHGKTTSTKLLSDILDNSIALIGDGSYKVSKNNKYFIIESCEYKNTFLNYHPYISLILNVDYDHVDFFKTKDEYDNAFIKFINQSQIAIVNKDDSNIKVDNCIYYSSSFYHYEKGTITINGKKFNLPFVGKKLAKNFMGIYLVLKLLGISDEHIQKKLDTFIPAKRRYEKVIKDKQIIICDYAHHPQEIENIYQMIKEEYNLDIICIFEPHTISRLNYFIDEYKNALSKFEETYLYEVFTSVRENSDITKINNLYNYLEFKRYNKEVFKSLQERKNVVICFLGAGVIDKEFKMYVENKE